MRAVLADRDAGIKAQASPSSRDGRRVSPLAITMATLTNGAFFALRGVDPVVLAVVHITDNRANALKEPVDEAAQRERNYANRAGSGGPSAHFYVNRNGSAVQAVDLAHAAWSNGDLKSPYLANAGVAKLVALRDQGVNANRAVYLETECVGWDAPAGQWTTEQFETVAQLIADGHHATGLPIDRDHVLPHAYINTVDRTNCPFLHGGLDLGMDRLIARARVLAAPPAPVPDPKPVGGKAMRFVQVPQAVVDTLPSLAVPAGVIYEDLAGSPFMVEDQDTHVPYIGLADAHSNRRIVVLQTGRYYDDHEARPTAQVAYAPTGWPK